MTHQGGPIDIPGNEGFWGRGCGDDAREGSAAAAAPAAHGQQTAADDSMTAAAARGPPRHRATQMPHSGGHAERTGYDGVGMIAVRCRDAIGGCCRRARRRCGRRAGAGRGHDLARGHAATPGIAHEGSRISCRVSPPHRMSLNRRLHRKFTLCPGQRAAVAGRCTRGAGTPTKGRHRSLRKPLQKQRRNVFRISKASADTIATTSFGLSRDVP